MMGRISSPRLSLFLNRGNNNSSNKPHRIYKQSRKCPRRRDPHITTPLPLKCLTSPKLMNQNRKSSNHPKMILFPCSNPNSLKTFPITRKKIKQSRMPIKHKPNQPKPKSKLKSSPPKTNKNQFYPLKVRMLK